MISIGVGIEILQLTTTRNKNIAKNGRITRALKPPNLPFPLWKSSPPEAYNDYLCRKTLVGITYNTNRGFKMKQGMRHVGYSELSPNIALFKSVFSDKMRKLLNEYNVKQGLCLIQIKC